MVSLSPPAGGKILWLHGDLSVADHWSLLTDPCMATGWDRDLQALT